MVLRPSVICSKRAWDLKSDIVNKELCGGGDWWEKVTGDDGDGGGRTNKSEECGAALYVLNRGTRSA